ncbi:universal stress protein [Thalassoglobus polymorphus]|uniref:Universal stress protein n=1 Tax=Thalassoglobus polymorphus TaxID=2527994 RepID=A0A517QJM8_9PLAN|nr:universal stress protein [Thalassoglobus polymorphus]QDT31841.1 Putative universal stress protein [Thalassoglobus polymorphus]
MVNLKRILFPTDFSECAEAAAVYASDLASRYDAELQVLHVIHDVSLDVPDFGMGLAFPGYLENLPQRRKEISSAVKQSLELLISQFPEGLKAVDSHMKFGNPISEILEFVETQDIDLIVMGTHGRTGFSHAILGSVAERVLRHAQCPVLTIRGDQTDGTTPDKNTDDVTSD